MKDTVDLLVAAASVISAIGGGFAAWAAFKSAASARSAQESTERAELRVALRQLSTTAGLIAVEVARVRDRGSALKIAHRSLATLSGTSGSSRVALYESAIDDKVKQSEELAIDAELWKDGATTLQSGPPEEIDRVQRRLSVSLRAVEAIREDLEREHATVESQCSEYRQRMLSHR